MKIQCPCGAKYSVDVTPEMAARPVQFVCQACGTDSSDAVNAMIRQELGQLAPVGIMIPSENEPAIALPPAPRTSGPRIHTSAPKPESGGATSAGGAPARQVCLKHPGQPIAHQCLVCNKPMCPKCMELFGYVCSPFCKSRAEAQRLDIPNYAGQTYVAESRFWRKFAFVAGSIAAVIIALLGAWFWYVWVGSRPSTVFSVRFEDGARTGQSQVCDQKQIVFLHGTTLYRYDLKTKKQVWARKLVDEKRISDEVHREMQEMQTIIRKVQEHDPNAESITPDEEALIEAMLDAATGLQLYVHGSNVWVRTPDKLVRCDWDSGSPVQEIPLDFGFGPLIHRGDELLAMGGSSGPDAITHINLNTAQMRVEEIGDGSVLEKRDMSGFLASGGGPAGGLPLGGAGANGGKALDPEQVQAEVQKLPLAGKIALPAILSVQMNQQRALQEMRDQDAPKTTPRGTVAPKPPPRDFFSLIPSEYGYVEFSSRLLESRIVQRQAMKDPPKKSMIDGNLTASQSLDAANEILNEMQRNAGGGTVTEDESRYRVTVRVPGGKVPDWSAEVIGNPRLFPLPSVTVVAGGKSVVVLDKNNKKLWESALSARIPSIYEDDEYDEPDTGHGPCVEREGKLYVFDQLVLTVFDLHTGNVQWRLPTVGVTGLFFDQKGKLYVNTTTAGPEAVKYARQIDVTQQTGSVVLKVDPATGKILWRAEPGGTITHIEGKFIYIVKAFQDMGGIGGMRIIDTPSYMQIMRLNPDDGRVMWEHRQDRAPLDVKFHKNTIQLVFRKEVQVLKFLSF